MKRTGQPALTPAGLPAGMLAILLIIEGTGCASLQRNLRPMTDAEAIERYRHDPRFADHELSPWERQRRDQELRWQLDHCEYHRNH